MTLKERAEFQLFQDLACMPFAEFYDAMYASLRPIGTHEFTDMDGLRKEWIAKFGEPHTTNN